MHKLLLIAVLCLPEAARSFAVGGRAALVGRRQPTTAPHTLITMGSDKEFEEWARQKKIASGVDPDEDFGASRRFSQTLLAGGGVIAVVVPTLLAIWAYNEGYLTPQ